MWTGREGINKQTKKKTYKYSDRNYAIWMREKEQNEDKWIELQKNVEQLHQHTNNGSTRRGEK